jgi:uncharacterized membrane protein (DUF485 family)
MKTAPSFTRDPDFPVADDIQPDFEALHNSEEFTQLRRRLLRFVLPMSGLFLTWYLTYVILAAYAHDFMSHRVYGNITVGLLLGLSQFVTTIVIMLCYLRFARRHVDPPTERLRAQMDAGR